MKLLTEEIKAKIPKLYSTEDVPLNDKLLVCKFFTPDSSKGINTSEFIHIL